jgi:hypothetical protein
MIKHDKMWPAGLEVLPRKTWPAGPPGPARIPLQFPISVGVGAGFANGANVELLRGA